MSENLSLFLTFVATGHAKWFFKWSLAWVNGFQSRETHTKCSNSECKSFHLVNLSKRSIDSFFIFFIFFEVKDNIGKQNLILGQQISSWII